MLKFLFDHNSGYILAEPEESKESLPWKIARDDDPVVYSEDWSAVAGHEPVLSDRDHGDKSDTPEEVSEEKEAPSKRGGVMFHIGEDEEKDEAHDEEYKKNHRKTSGSRKSGKKDRHHPEVQLEMRRRQGSELQIAENVLYEEEDVENLKEGDIEEIAGHRFEKSKGMTKHKISHGHHKPHMVRVGHNEANDIGKDMKMMSSMGYGFRTELDHSPHELFVEMDELEGEEWVERSR